MSDVTGTPAGSDAAPADTSELSIDQARELIFAEPPAESAEDEATANLNAKADRETQEHKLSKDNSAPETDPAEAPQEAEPAEVPPIDPPRSWTQAEKERFQSLPRETQEYLSHREQERETALRRSQNEVAEQRKAVQAEREAAEKVKQQYEANLPALMRELQNAQQSSFADIKTMEDVARLQEADPFRFQAWQVQQMKLQAANLEIERARTEEATKKQNDRAAYEQAQTRLLVELIPDMGDPKKANDLRNRAVTMLTDDLGFSNDELSNWMADDTGFKILSDARWQKLIADRLTLKDIQSAPKAVAAKPVPPVQRPGVARPAGADDSELIQTLEKRLNQTGSIKDAEALMNARENARRRTA